MEQTMEAFFEDFLNERAIGAQSNGNFALTEFVESFGRELVDSGFVDGFESCDYRSPAPRGPRVDGYWFGDDGVLDLYIADFESRMEVASLSKAQVDAAFKRLSKFFEMSSDASFVDGLDIVTPVFSLARQIADRGASIHKINLFLLSERVLSEHVKSLDDGEIDGVLASHQVWDLSRLKRQREARGHKEPLDLDLMAMFGKGLPCLPANLDADGYQSYLIVIPGEMLATLYERFGSRLLEQNVRTFLQARAGVNKGIRATILSEPKMFFAYNNGVTATAQSVDVSELDGRLTINRLTDLQIVNGGQTTASLFHTRRKDKADLSSIHVQMKLSVVENGLNETIVPKISQYANTQNKVSEADFFSNHPFHVRMESFSRRMWAPASNGVQKETKWFYERARGQYADAQSALTAAEQRRFLLEFPKIQMFTKTDLAKFENVWEDHPKWVNRGAQKNFAQFAVRIGEEWERSASDFNEFYFQRTVARALMFKASERIVSDQPWYSGGYRANIVAYTLALLNEIVKSKYRSVDVQHIWKMQCVSDELTTAIAIIAKAVHSEIVNPPNGVSNVTEWCKKDECWDRIRARSGQVRDSLASEFFDSLVRVGAQTDASKDAKQVQKIDDGIEAQKLVLARPAQFWFQVFQALSLKGEVTDKEVGVLKIASQIPKKIPTDKQSVLLLELLERAKQEGVAV
ncbi:MAG: AIPR family protein [Comamonas sp.]